MTGHNGLLLDILRSDQFTPAHLDILNRRADSFQKPTEIAQAATDLQNLYSKYGKLAVFFWFEEPSSRTYGSFDSARALLGMERLGQNSAKITSSAAKGETLRDTMRTVDRNLRKFGGAVVVMRHSQPLSAQVASEELRIPVINAGDGQNEHPTQALLDMYTILQRHGRLDNLKVVMGGDPRYSRTIHSLAQMLAMYPNNEITLVGGADLWLEDETKSKFDDHGVNYSETTDMDVLSEADVVYWTRLQTERFSKGRMLKHPMKFAIETTRNKRIIRQYVNRYSLNEAALELIPDHASIMHPLPRGVEIPESIDRDPRAAYWDQVENAVPVRAALLEHVLRQYHVVRGYAYK